MQMQPNPAIKIKQIPITVYCKIDAITKRLHGCFMTNGVVKIAVLDYKLTTKSYLCQKQKYWIKKLLK